MPRFRPDLRFGITAKLFIAVLFTNVVTAVAVGFGVRYAFDSGFERYIREREEQRLTRLADVFANAYRQAGNWEFLRGNDEMWLQLNHLVRPAPHEGERHDRRFAGTPNANPIARAPGFGRPPPGLVLDNDERIVAGDANPQQELKRRPIVVQGQQVGWLAYPVRVMPFDVLDRRFQQAQWEASSLVALIGIAMAAIVTWFLARGLLAPVKRIAGATRRLADGDYSTRVVSTSGDELGRLVDDFNRLGNALEKNESSRRHFMADVSHELRTPIAILKGELEAIEDGVREPDTATVKSLQAEVARLGKLVDDIHDLALADVGGLAFRFEDVSLEPLVVEIVDASRSCVESRRLDLEVSAPAQEIRVRGDPQRLRQLVSNLLGNTLRYTHEGGKVRVALAKTENRAVLAWEDSEPGVPDAALPKLFDRFFRVEHSRSREGGGSGLGLAICKSIVEAHGGTIAAGGSALGGVRIEVQLPLAQGATA
ncbi:MAG TPA: ATP-binding protein [Usitatibacter sp.]|nr:ATP-binding protein [Usitatibacter sp.]